jgi:hypothetical protein
MTATDKRLVIEDISFGGRTAEEESDQLARYFVETEQWRKVWQDEVDIVFAPKGGGKSAIYSMLVSREGDLFDRGVVLVPGENPTGATAFEPIQDRPPTSEKEFIQIWRLYFLVLLVEELERYDVVSKTLHRVRESLATVGLTKGVQQKRTIVVRVREALGKVFSPKSVEAGMNVDAATGMITGYTAKISFDEPTAEQAEAGIASVDRLYEDLNTVLVEEDLHVWLIIDRLDVAFTSSPELEANALRALFRVYRLIEPLSRLRLKIFLRTDIWNEITAGGFRETSHITRDLTLQWGRANLLKLIVQRLLQSDRLRDAVGVSSPEEVVASSSAQEAFFDRVFPKQVDAGEKKLKTFAWALSRTQDGKAVSAPRELIHLFTIVRNRQLDRVDTGQASIPEDVYFEAQSFREATAEVSKTRLEKTIYAEYPWSKDWLEALRGQRTLQNALSLESVWGTDGTETEERIRRLVDIGFFEQRGSVTHRTYWVPFLFRPALELVQGTADSAQTAAGESDGDEPEEQDE